MDTILIIGTQECIEITMYLCTRSPLPPTGTPNGQLKLCFYAYSHNMCLLSNNATHIFGPKFVDIDSQQFLIIIMSKWLFY